MTTSGRKVRSKPETEGKIDIHQINNTGRDFLQ